MTCRLSNLTCPAAYEYCLHPIAPATVPQCCGIHTVSNCNKVRQQTTFIHTTLLPHSAITWGSHVQPVPALRVRLGDLQTCCNCQWKRRLLKLIKPAQLGFKDVQHLAQLCTTIHFRIGQIYILAAGLPYMRGVNAHYTVTRRKIDLMCFVIAHIISWPVIKKSGPNWSSRMNARGQAVDKRMQKVGDAKNIEKQDFCCHVVVHC